MSKPMELVWVADGTPQAEMIQALLKAAGIEAVLSGEGAARVYGFTVGPMAQVEIFVAAEDVAEARAIIEQMRGET